MKFNVKILNENDSVVFDEVWYGRDLLHVKNFIEIGIKDAGLFNYSNNFKYFISELI